jgi:hypothetical protein
MMGHLGGGLRGLVLRLYFRLFVADVEHTLQEGQFVGSRLMLLDCILAVYTLLTTAYICLFGISATNTVVYSVLSRCVLELHGNH